MDQFEYRAKRETGELVGDADLAKEETVVMHDNEEQEEHQEETHQEEAQSEEQGEPDETELPEEEEIDLPEEQKPAFVKRMEREREKLRQELEQEYESKYGKHKKIVESLGGDVDEIERRLEENRLRQEAESLADEHGWDEQQTHWYIEQQKKEQRLQDLEIQVQINDLRDNPTYAGIADMKKIIADKIKASNGALSVQEAYWAVGGHKRAEQIKLEAEQRAIAKRAKQPRTVLTDSPTANTAEKALPSDVLREAERMGISPQEARRLMNEEPARNIDEWRAKRKKA